MTLKKLDQGIDIFLWIVFLGLCVGSWFISIDFCAPTYEYVNLKEMPYTFKDDDGFTVESTYDIVWNHEHFSSPKIILYDSKYGNKAKIKDEYLPQIQAEMPPSQYGAFYYRWFWIIFPLLLIISALIVYFGGGYVRDCILYSKLKKNPNFKDCSYFLYTDRIAKKAEVEEMIPQTIGSYIDTKLQDLKEKYNETFVALIERLLTVIKYYKSTTIQYTFSFEQNIIAQKDSLKKDLEYWEGRLAVDPNASRVCQRLKELLGKEYAEIKYNITATELSENIDKQLDGIFTKLMGEEVFRFKSRIYDDAVFRTIKSKPCLLHARIYARNDFRYFTWSGSDYDKELPGIHIYITISNFIDGKENILWNTSLEPISTYKSESFDLKDFYNNMIEKTVDSFKEKIKS